MLERQLQTCPAPWMGCVLPSAQVSLASEHRGDDHCFNRALIGDDFNQGRFYVGYI